MHFVLIRIKGVIGRGKINDITGHLRSSDGCLFEEGKCSNDCDLLLRQQHLPSHVDNGYPCCEVHCQYCSMAGQYQFITGQQVEQCSKPPLPCPNSCGVDSILCENMEEHKTSYTCPLQEVECPSDWSKVLQK